MILLNTWGICQKYIRTTGIHKKVIEFFRYIYCNFSKSIPNCWPSGSKIPISRVITAPRLVRLQAFLKEKSHKARIYCDFSQKPRDVRKLPRKARTWTISKYRVNGEPLKPRTKCSIFFYL